MLQVLHDREHIVLAKFAVQTSQNTKFTYYNNSIKTLLKCIKFYQFKAQSLIYLDLKFGVKQIEGAKVDKINLAEFRQKLGSGIFF